MTKDLKKAAKGDRRAMLSVYEAHKRPVYFICCNFLKDETQAGAKTEAVFSELWAALLAGENFTESGLRHYLYEKAVRSCLECLPLDEGRELFQTSERSEAGVETNVYITWLLASLTVRYKTFFLMQALRDNSAGQTAPILGMEPRAADIQWHAAENALSRQLSKLQIKDSIGTLTYSVLCQEVRSMAEGAKVPIELDDNVREYITEVTKARYRRKTKITCGIIAAVVIVIGAVIGAMYLNRQKYFVEAELEIENYGTISLKLDSAVAAVTVANFVELAESGFYDGLTFHRIIEGFMMQGGDPNGNGSGGSGKNITGEFYYNGYPNYLAHTRGVISMARAEDYNSASSQFFIMHADSASLDGLYAAFGWVTDGMDIVDEICSSTPVVDENGTVLPEHQPKIVTIRILE